MMTAWTMTRMNREVVEIPNKSSFKVNEVCALTGIKSYVLRFWESQFSAISPLTTSSGIKLYEHRDVEAILTIKKLLFEEKLPIEKAKSFMESHLDNSDDDYAESFSEDLLSQQDVNKEKQTIGIPLPLTERILLESDLQKIISAKNKLNDILSQCKSVQEKNNWV